MSRFAIRDFKAGDRSVCVICDVPFDVEKRGILGVDRMLATIAEKNQPVCPGCLQVEDAAFAYRYSEISRQDEQREYDHFGQIRTTRYRAFEAAKKEKLDAQKIAKAISEEWEQEAKRSIEANPKRLKLKHQIVRHQQELVPLLEQEEFAAAKCAGHLAPLEALQIDAKVKAAQDKWNKASLDLGVLERAAPKNPMIFNSEKEKEFFNQRVNLHQEQVQSAREICNAALAEKNAAVQEDAAIKRARSTADVKQIDEWLSELRAIQEQTQEKRKLIRQTQEQLALLEKHLMGELLSTREGTTHEPKRS